MDSFCTILRNMETRSPIKIAPIKIAIIDDGIDATWPEINGRICKGKSFYPYPGSQEFFNAYYVPSGQHGTLIASLICKTCPQPELYIARMEERMTEGDVAHFAIESAIDVRLLFLSHCCSSSRLHTSGIC